MDVFCVIMQFFFCSLRIFHHNAGCRAIAYEVSHLSTASPSQYPNYCPLMRVTQQHEQKKWVVKKERLA
jgi:hypothetical protein